MKIPMLAVVFALCAAEGTIAQEVVRIGTEGAYPPFNFINDSGEPDGFEVELGNALCERAGLTCEWVTNEWDSMIRTSSRATTTPSWPG